MKRLTLLIALLASVITYGQWTNDPAVNTLVANSESEDMKAAGTSNGETYVVFWKSVGAPANYELRVQLLDASGVRQFGDDGMLLDNTLQMSTWTAIMSLTVDEQDNLYVGVTATSDYSGHAYKINTSGTKLWGDNGITFGTGFMTTVLPLQTGDAIVAWNAGTEINMQKYDSNGNAVWSTAQPVTIGSSKTSPGNLFEMSNGDFMMIIHTYNYGINSTVYIQRFDGTGEPVWSSPVQLSNTSTVYNTEYSGVQDADTVYFGYKGAHSNRFDSYLQRINPDGTLPWGINGSDFDINETDFEMDTRIAFSPGSQYIWSICKYSNPNQTQFGEYVQKFDKISGARLLTDNAKMIYAIGDDDKVHASDLFLMDDGPFFLLKTGVDNGVTPTTLAVLLLDENGDFVWPDETKPMATYPANKKRTQLTKPAGGQSVAVFIEDKSDGLKIYAQNYIEETPLPSQPVLLSPENGASGISIDTTFVWEVAQDADTYTIQIAEDDAFTNIVTEESGLTATSFDYTLPEYNTTYYWRVMATNSAGDSDWSEIWSFTTVVMTGMIETITTSTAKVYPNPATDFIVFEFTSPVNSDVRLTLFNSTGQTEFTMKKFTKKGKTNFKVIRKFPAGVYYYRLSGEKLMISGKIVIK